MLLAIDLSNLVIRHAANPYRTDTDKKDRPVGGAAGSINQIITLIEEVRPDYLLLARDGHRSNIFRTEIDENYKAHRPEADSRIKHNFATTYKSLDVLGWSQISVEGYEADDIIASAASQFQGESLVVSGDKDLLALCSSKVTVRLLRPGGHIDCDPGECEKIIGVSPDLVSDYKALVGDQSDGIVGIPGIGPKRALKLIEDYGSLDGVIKAAENVGSDKLPGFSEKVTETIVLGIESAKTSYNLAEIVKDLEVDLDSIPCPDVFSIPAIDKSQTKALEEFGLGAVSNRLNGIKSKPKKPEKKLSDIFESAIEF